MNPTAVTARDAAVSTAEGAQQAGVVPYRGTLALGLAAGAVIDFTFVEQLPAGRVRGDIGLSLVERVPARIEIRLTGEFLFTTWRDRRNRLRIQVRTADTPVGSCRVEADLAPEHEAAAELASALAGVHPLQWLEDLGSSVATGIPPWIETRLRCRPAALTRLLDAWAGIGSRPAAVIWGAGAQRSGLDGIRFWGERLSRRLRDIGSFETAFDRALERHPAFPASDAALWMEAAGGCPVAMLDSAAFAQLRREAKAAVRILTDPELRDTLARLRRYAAAHLGLRRVCGALDDLGAYARLDSWVRRQFAGRCGPVLSRAGLARVREMASAAAESAAQLCRQAAPSLRRKAAADLACVSGGAAPHLPLLEVSFARTPRGSGLYEQALRGDFRSLAAPGESECAISGRGLFTHGLRQRTPLELALPFHFRLRNSRAIPAQPGTGTPRDALRGTALVLSSGLELGARVHDAANYSVDWATACRIEGVPGRSRLDLLCQAYGFGPDPSAWMRAQPPEAPIDAAFSLRIPGDCAHAWLRTPPERHPAYVPALSALSLAVQRTLRRWVPWICFEGRLPFERPGYALPVLAYQSTSPGAGKSRTRITRDHLTAVPPGLRSLATRLQFRLELAAVCSELTASGLGRAARYYHPVDANEILSRLARCPQAYRSLLSAEHFLVEALIGLAVSSRGFGSSARTDPARAAATLSRRAARFAAVVLRTLRHLYRGADFSSFGPLLLIEATSALHSALSGPAGVQAILELSESGQGVARTFVNAAFRP